MEISSMLPSETCERNAPMRSASTMYGCITAYSSADTDGTLTAFWMTPRFKYSFTCWAICTPTASWASKVDPPTCGVSNTFSKASSGEFFGGSSAKTSMAAAATCFSWSALARSASITSSPRAQFTSRTPLFICYRDRNEGIVSDQLHAKRSGPPRDFHPDSSQADDAQRFCAQLGSLQRLLLPLARMHERIGAA